MFQNNMTRMALRDLNAKHDTLVDLPLSLSDNPVITNTVFYKLYVCLSWVQQ